jgi:hypothetical protein
MHLTIAHHAIFLLLVTVYGVRSQVELHAAGAVAAVRVAAPGAAPEVIQ